jgi:hypothetical protein
MAASAPDSETPLGIGIIVNRMAGQAIFAWNRPFFIAHESLHRERDPPPRTLS